MQESYWKIVKERMISRTEQTGKNLRVIEDLAVLAEFEDDEDFLG